MAFIPADARVVVSDVGNTSGVTGGFPRLMILAGGDNITLSGATDLNAMTVTISGAAGGGGGAGTNTLGISNLGNTSGTSGVITGSNLQFILAGGNNIVLSQSINGSSATVTISASNQSVQTQMTGLTAGLSNIGNTSGDTALVSRRLVFAGGNNITLSGSTDANSMTITVSAFNQSVQTQMTGLTAGLSNIGNTAGDTGLVSNRLVLAGGNNITLSGSTNGQSMTITISGAAGGGAAGSISAGTTRATLGEVVFSNSNGISFGVNGQTVTASYTVPTVPAQFSGGLSNIGNTSGDTGVVTGRLVFAGGNNITLSGSTNAGSMTITVSAANETQTVPAAATTVSRVQSVNVVGTQTSFARQDHQHEGLYAIDIGGNTAGTTSSGAGSFRLAGGPNITLSGSTAAGGMTVSISGGAGGGGGAVTYSQYMPYDEAENVVGQVGQGTLFIQPQVWPNVQFDRLAYRILASKATNSTGSATISLWAGFYTKNGSTLSLAHSSSTTLGLTLSGTANSSLYSSARVMTMGWTTTVTANNYWVGLVSRTTTGGNQATFSNFLQSQMASSFSGILGVASATSAQRILGQGIYTATTSAIPASIAFSQISGTGSAHHRPPLFYVLSGTA